MLRRMPRYPGEDEYGEREPDPGRFSRGCLIGIGGGLAIWAIIGVLVYLKLMGM